MSERWISVDFVFICGPSVGTRHGVYKGKVHAWEGGFPSAGSGGSAAAAATIANAKQVIVCI